MPIIPNNDPRIHLLVCQMVAGRPRLIAFTRVSVIAWQLTDQPDGTPDMKPIDHTGGPCLHHWNRGRFTSYLVFVPEEGMYDTGAIEEPLVSLEQAKANLTAIGHVHMDRGRRPGAARRLPATEAVKA